VAGIGFESAIVPLLYAGSLVLVFSGDVNPAVQLSFAGQIGELAERIANPEPFDRNHGHHR